MISKILVCGTLIAVGGIALFVAVKKGQGSLFLLLIAIACFSSAYKYATGKIQ